MDNESPKSILDLEARNKQANSLETDFRSEVVAANLIEQGYDPERIMLIREGDAKRGYAKDIEKTLLEYSQYDLKDYLMIKTNRECIYDILPEGIFHQTKNRRYNKDKEDIIDEIKLQRQEEFFARRFFQPFEIELDKFLIDSYLFEAKYDKRITHSNFTRIFHYYWPVLEVLEREQAVLLLHTIPLLHRIRNSFAEIEEAMSLILDAGVEITKIKLQKQAETDEQQTNLNERRLGVDFVLGRTFDDGVLDLKVTIGPISANRMEFYLKNPSGIKILNMLFEIFLPGNLFFIHEFKLKPEDADFTLSCENKNTFLGINTFL